MESSQNSFKHFESDSIKEKIKAQKKFIIKMNNKKYRLTIINFDKSIHLKINDINSLNLYYYQNKYTLKDIINSLKLDIDSYDNFDKIMDLIKNTYLNNNILLKLFNNYINLIIRYNNYECIFTLNKYDLEINEKFDIVINEINNIRKNKNITLIANKLEQSEKLLNDLKKLIYRTLTKNSQTIHLLKNEISKNMNVLNDNKKTIQLLFSELSKLHKNFDEFKEKDKKLLINNIQKEKKEVKNDGGLFIINDINRNYYKNIQITIFTSNNTNGNTINVFDNSFLKNYNHSMIEKKNNKIEFNIQLMDTVKPLKIKIYSIFNFNTDVEYNLINNVSCYILLIDLDNDKKEHYKLILEYIKYNCNNHKKLYILGMFNGKEGKRYIYEEDIFKQLYDFALEYEYININISNERHISEIIKKILLYCSEHPIISENEIQEKNNKINYPEL